LNLRKIFTIFFIVLNLTLILIPNTQGALYETFTEDFTTSNYIASQTDTYHNTTGDFIDLAHVTDKNSTLWDTPFITTDLEINFNFNENDTATNVIDGQNLNNGTFAGNANYTDYDHYLFNRSAYFDGASYINVTDNTDLDSTDANTVAFWVVWEDITNPNEAWMWRKREGYGVRKQGSSINYMEVYGKDHAEGKSYAFQTIQANTPYHLVMTYNNITDSMKFYCNSTLKLDYTPSTSLGEIKDTGWVLTVGSYLTTTFNFNGTADNFRYWSRELNQSEINEEYSPTVLEGNITSKNLLADLGATRIDEATFNCSIITGSTIDVMFSENGLDWYDNNGNLDSWVSLSNGLNVIDLLDLGFTSNIQYKAKLTKGSVFPLTPQLINIMVAYQPSMTDLTLIYMVFILVLGMFLISILGLLKPIICFATIGITLMVVLPQLSNLDNFLISFSVGSLFFQTAFLMLGYVRNR
jgi:hypothetical protein